MIFASLMSSHIQAINLISSVKSFFFTLEHGGGFIIFVTLSEKNLQTSIQYIIFYYNLGFYALSDCSKTHVLSEYKTEKACFIVLRI